MITFSNRKASRKIIQDLVQRFLAGEKMPIRQIVTEYFKPKTELNYIRSDARARSWMQSVKRTLKQEHGVRDFGCLDEDGNFGIATVEEETKFVLNDRFALSKGINENIRGFAEDAIARGTLPAPKVTQERLDTPHVLIGGKN